MFRFLSHYLAHINNWLGRKHYRCAIKDGDLIVNGTNLCKIADIIDCHIMYEMTFNLLYLNLNSRETIRVIDEFDIVVDFLRSHCIPIKEVDVNEF